MALDAERREELEAERAFLLRSLDDLDGELRAGNIEPDQYRVLHDDYTARAAAVITSLDDNVDHQSPGAPRASRVVRVVTIGGIVAFAVVGSFLLAHAVGQRHPGQTITGNSQVSGATGPSAANIGALKSAAAAQPTNYAAQIAYARALFNAGNYTDAIQQYIATAKLDPKQAEPLAYTGWISALVARQVVDRKVQATLFSAAESSLNHALVADPSYVPAYAFKGVTLAVFENKPCDGVPAFQEYLVRAPQDDPLRNQVVTALAAAVKSGKCPAGSAPATTTPTTNP